MTSESYSILGEAVRVLVILLLLIPVAYLVTRAYGVRMRKTGLGRAMQVLEVAHLGAGRSLFLVQVGRRLLVIGMTAHSVSLVAEISEPDEVAALIQRTGKRGHGTFGELLQARLTRERQGEDENR